MSEDHMARSDLAKAVLAAWVNVPVDQLPAEKMWIEHPNDLNRQAWDRVIAAAQRPLLDRIAELEGERGRTEFMLAVMAGCARQSKIQAEMNEAFYEAALFWQERALAAEAQVSALTRENEGLREALEEAAELVECWGAYAGQYFQEKHDLEGDVARLRAALSPTADEPAKGEV